MPIKLDRIELEDAGANPEKLATAIHDQLGTEQGPIDVQAIAFALDIEEIRREVLRNFEGALVTQPERSYGRILVNSRSSPERQKFTIGHELLHFLNPRHTPTAEEGFWCTKADMHADGAAGETRHLRQEAEANRFAAELLAPVKLLKPFLQAQPDLADVQEIAATLKVSKHVAARRYANLHPADTAIVFSKHGKFQYYDARSGFPSMRFTKGRPLPALPTASGNTAISECEDADPSDWLRHAEDARLTVQCLHQEEGHAMVLLTCELPDEADEMDDLADRFQSYSEPR